MNRHLKQITSVTVMAFSILCADLATAPVHSVADAGLKDRVLKKIGFRKNKLGVTKDTQSGANSTSSAAASSNITVNETYSSAGLVSSSANQYSSSSLVAQGETITASEFEAAATVEAAQSAAHQATLGSTATSTAMHNHVNSQYVSFTGPVVSGNSNYEQTTSPIGAQEAEITYGNLAQVAGQPVNYEQLLPTNGAVAAGGANATASTAQAEEATAAETVSVAEGLNAQFKNKLESTLFKMP